MIYFGKKCAFYMELMGKIFIDYVIDDVITLLGIAIIFYRQNYQICKKEDLTI